MPTDSKLIWNYCYYSWVSYCWETFWER